MNSLNQIYVNLRAAIRLTLFSLVMTVFFVAAGIKYLVTADPVERRKKLSHGSRQVALRIMKSFGVELI